MYELLEIRNIKKDDYYITDELEIQKAFEDYPENNGSFILKFIKEV